MPHKKHDIKQTNKTLNVLAELPRIKYLILQSNKKIDTLIEEKIYISFGENCLTDRLLERHGLKSFATPYSWGLSNIEYALQLERNQYKDFLNPQKMVYAEVNGEKKVRLNTYNDIKNNYEPMCMNGFEFTHHDVLADPVKREGFLRRYCRLLEKNKAL